jgi:hypothetical protein
MASLHIIGGPTAGTRIDLGREHTVIGRSPECDIVVPITAISRRHARVTQSKGRFVLDDLQSRGGTYLNMRQIRGLSPLRDGDHIRICDFEAVFERQPGPMTEADWFATTDSQALLAWLRHTSKTSERRLRLFVAACCRRFGRPGNRRDAAASPEALEQQAERTGRPAGLVGPLASVDLWQTAADAAQQAAEDASATLVWPESSGTWSPPVRRPEAERWVAFESAEDVLCRLLRDIFGNPFCPLPPISPSVLAFHGGIAVKLATSVYDERDFSHQRMGILADALEAAGLNDQDVLGHLRGSGPHVRGCWAIDRLTGRE